jgi:hypothetical protein
MNFVLSVKCATKIKVEPLIFVVQLVYEVSHRMFKWSAQNAVQHSHCLEGTKRTLILLLLLFDKHKRDHIQIHIHSKYPNLPSADSDENHGQPTFEASSSSSGPHLLTQGDLSDLFRDKNLSKKTN